MQKSRNQMMKTMDPRAQCTFFTTGSGSDFLPNFARRETSAIPAHSIMRAISQSRESPFWGSTKAASVELLPGFAGNRMELWRTRSHRSLSEKIRTLWPPADAALIDAILIGENPILERTSQPYGKGLFYLDSQNYDRSLPPRVAQFRLDLRMISGRLERFLGVQIPRRMLFWGSRAALAPFEVFVISALLQVGLAVPIAYYFHFATVV